VSRRDYLHTVIRLFLEQPGAPPRASRADWATAQAVYDAGVPLEDVLHAIRLVALRRSLRLGPLLPPVRTFAYYRLVLDQLTPDERDADYVDYVDRRYQALALKARALHSQDRALSDDR
jgi:hypothetical protein